MNAIQYCAADSIFENVFCAAVADEMIDKNIYGFGGSIHPQVGQSCRHLKIPE